MCFAGNHQRPTATSTIGNTEVSATTPESPARSALLSSINGFNKSSLRKVA